MKNQITMADVAADRVNHAYRHKEDQSGGQVDGWEYLEAWWEDTEAQAEGSESVAAALTRFLEKCGQPCDDIKAVV